MSPDPERERSSRRGTDPRTHRVAEKLLGPLVSRPARKEIVGLLEDLRRHRVESGKPVRAHLRYWIDLIGFLWTALLSSGDLEPAEMELRPWRLVSGGEGLLPSVLSDLRFSLRSYASTPLLSLAALATIALAIGANTAIFSFFDAILLRPLPIPEADRVVAVFHQSIENPERFSSFSYPDYEDLRNAGGALDGLAAYAPASLILGSGSEASEVESLVVSGNFFSVLRVSPILGRTFLPEEGRVPAAHPVVVVSESFWRSRLGGRRGAIGARILLNDHPFTVIGVAADDTPAPGRGAAPAIWAPLMMHEVLLPTFRWRGESLFHNRGTHWLSVLGRLSPDGNLESAQSALGNLAREQAQDHPTEDDEWRIALVPAEEARVGPPSRRTPIRIAGLLFAVVGMVLLIACANVANLLLARAELRRKEMAIRLSLGAGRLRLMRQVLVESLFLSLAAGGLGIILAVGSMGFLSRFWTTLSPGPIDVRLDHRVLLFALSLATLTGLAFGTLPASRASMAGVAAGGGRGGGWRLARRRGSPKELLIVLQVAFSIVLLMGAGLMLRTVWNLQSVPLGFDLEGVRVVRMEPSSDVWTVEEEKRVQQNLIRALRSMPGVHSASLTFVAPLGGGRMADDLFWERPGSGGGRSRTTVDMNVVGVDFFETMGIPLSAGRPFTRWDGPESEKVVVINEALAEQLWPGEVPLGRSLWRAEGGEAGEILRVVGVAENGRYHRSWESADRPFLFLPHSQHFYPSTRLVYRHEPGGGPTDGEVLSRLKEVEPDLLGPRVVSLKASLAEATASVRITARLLVLFGALAVAMAGVGIYGVASHSVTRRHHELGVRMAMGASRRDVGRAVLRESLAPVLAGSLLGGLIALALGRVIEGLLYQVTPGDPITLGVVMATLSLVGALAVAIPARRATRVDPVRIMNADG